MACFPSVCRPEQKCPHDLLASLSGTSSACGCTPFPVASPFSIAVGLHGLSPTPYTEGQDSLAKEKLQGVACSKGVQGGGCSWHEPPQEQSFLLCSRTL